jgi:hypothetical protein
MQEPVDWFDRLIALAGLVWAFGTPFVALREIREDQTLLGIWFIAAWFLGMYAFCKIWEGLQRSKRP